MRVLLKNAFANSDVINLGIGNHKTTPLIVLDAVKVCYAESINDEYIDGLLIDDGFFFWAIKNLGIEESNKICIDILKNEFADLSSFKEVEVYMVNEDEYDDSDYY